MTRTAVIVGSGGQDGTLLSKFLAARDYHVIGVSRQGVHPAGIADPFDIRDGQAVDAFVRQTVPDEIYFLAAHHHSSQDRTEDDGALFLASQEVNVTAFIHFVDAARRHASATRIFYAASSHVFGAPEQDVQDEDTPMRPVTPYGVSKAAGLGVCQYYREVRGMFVAAGILYNHESSLRGPQFISRKLARAAADIKRGRAKEVMIGTLEAEADWGYAGDFVDAMWRTLTLGRADVFVIATGQAHSVRDMAEAAFGAAGLDYRDHVRVESGLLQRSTGKLVGNPARLRRETGWAPSVSFAEMMARMVAAELNGS